MTTEEAQKVIDELQDVRPEVLTGEAKRLFEAIMKIADERDELYKKVKELGKGQQTLIQSRRKWKNRYYKMKRKLKEKNKTIDLMAEMINNQDIDEDICKQVVLEKEECNEFEERPVCIECIKQYFENKAKEYLKGR